MSKKANPTLIGAFVLGAILLLVVVVAVFGSGELFKKQETWVVFFRGHANGLSIGAPVKLKGVQIGTVKHVNLIVDKDRHFYVEVVVTTPETTLDNPFHILEGLSQEEMLDELVVAGLRAQLEVQSLVLGLLYVKLDFFTDDPPRYVGLRPDMVEVPSRDPDDLTGGVARVLKSIEDMKLAELGAALVATVQSVDSLVSSLEIGGAIDRLDDTLGEIRNLAANLDSQVPDISANLQETSLSVRHAVAHLDSMIVRIERSAGNDRVEVYATLDDISRAARAVQALAEAIERRPEALMWGK